MGSGVPTGLQPDSTNLPDQVYYSKKPADGDVNAMADLRKKYVALIDAGVKKWRGYLDKQKKVHVSSLGSGLRGLRVVSDG
jgi:hypothetical protein